MQCPHCGNHVADGNAFCPNCGARQAVPAAPVNPYSNTNPYGQSNPYGQPNPYGQTNAYDQTNPYGQSNPYGNPNPYGQSNPYGNPNPYGAPYGAGQRGPKPSVGFVDAIKLYFSNYANFSGRSRRSEYWNVVLFNFLVGIVLGFVPALSGIWSLVTLVPGLALAVRRLHDLGKSGWYLLCALIPLVGWIIVLVWECADSDPRPNQYGPSPKYS